MKVLVTGATGFVAKWCVGTLLKAGYHVRGTVRSLDRSEEVKAAVRAQGADPKALELVEADLMADAGWATAMRGCRFVQHVASPFPLKPPRDPETLIRPAKEGTLRVLRHADTAGVERVVLTSSTVAILYPAVGPQSRTYDETDWTDPARPDLSAYTVSKTMAEQAAWAFVEGLGRRSSLAVVNPGLVLGPALDGDLAASHHMLRIMADGAYPAVPSVGYPIADARDVAEAHLHAMTLPGAGGERFIAAEGYLSMMDLAHLLKQECPHLGWRLPWFVMHDGFVKAYSLLDRRLTPVLPDLDLVRRTKNDKARRLLGLAFRSAEEAAVSAIRSLKALGLIR
jgi:nucleoside-diphosphate-sugar epimerase